jgi:drug/metabolite transporter (DMT)-like permease
MADSLPMHATRDATSTVRYHGALGFHPLVTVLGKWPAAAAALASLLTGAAVVVTRQVVETVPPLPLGWMRYSIALLCLIVPLLIFARRRLSLRQFIASLLLGSLFFGVFTLCFNLGLQTVTSARAGTIVATMPALTLLLAAAARIETLTLFKSVGVLMALAGVSVVLGEQATTEAVASGAAPPIDGQWWLVGAAVCGAIYNVGNRIWLSQLPAITVAFWSMTGGVCVLTAMSAISADWPTSQMLTLASGAAVLFLGTAAGALGFTLWIWALSKATPTQVAVFFTLNPVSAAVLGAIILNEAITASVALGMVVVLSGIVLTTLRRSGSQT